MGADAAMHGDIDLVGATTEATLFSTRNSQLGVRVPRMRPARAALGPFSPHGRWPRLARSGAPCLFPIDVLVRRWAACDACEHVRHGAGEPCDHAIGMEGLVLADPAHGASWARIMMVRRTGSIDQTSGVPLLDRKFGRWLPGRPCLLARIRHAAGRSGSARGPCYGWTAYTILARPEQAPYVVSAQQRARR